MPKQSVKIFKGGRLCTGRTQHTQRAFYREEMGIWGCLETPPLLSEVRIGVIPTYIPTSGMFQNQLCAQRTHARSHSAQYAPRRNIGQTSGVLWR